jgi:hypothetical protein
VGQPDAEPGRAVDSGCVRHSPFHSRHKVGACFRTSAMSRDLYAYTSAGVTEWHAR